MLRQVNDQIWTTADSRSLTRNEQVHRVIVPTGVLIVAGGESVMRALVLVGAFWPHMSAWITINEILVTAHWGRY
jgi:hypothetical protein